MELEKMAHHENPSRCFRLMQHLQPFRIGERERLFHKHILPAPQSGDGEPMMGFGWRGKHNCIDIFPFENAIKLFAHLDAGGDLTRPRPPRFGGITNDLEHAKLIEIADQILTPITAPENCNSTTTHKNQREAKPG